MIPFFFQFIRERIDLEALMLLSEADLGEVCFIKLLIDVICDDDDDEDDDDHVQRSGFGGGAFCILQFLFGLNRM